MQTSTLFFVIVALTLISYFTGQKRAQHRQHSERLLALPGHYGYMTAMWSAIPAAILLLAWACLLYTSDAADDAMNV